jgi:hypothetical protein
MFFNILLQIILFRNEKDLLSENNLELSYVQECYLWIILQDPKDLQTYLMHDTNKKLFENERQRQLYEMFYAKYSWLHSTFQI